MALMALSAKKVPNPRLACYPIGSDQSDQLNIFNERVIATKL